MRGGAQSLMCAADDGRTYIVKSTLKPQKELSLELGEGGFGRDDEDPPDSGCRRR